jgi:hypothetical protein
MLHRVTIWILTATIAASAGAIGGRQVTRIDVSIVWLDENEVGQPVRTVRRTPQQFAVDRVHAPQPSDPFVSRIHPRTLYNRPPPAFLLS